MIEQTLMIKMKSKALKRGSHTQSLCHMNYIREKYLKMLNY